MVRKVARLRSRELRLFGNLERICGALDAARSPRPTYCLAAREIRFSIEDWRAIESYQATQIAGQLISILRTRFRPELIGVAPGIYRIVHRLNRGEKPARFDYFDIQGARRDDTTREILELMCIRRDSAGVRAGRMTPPRPFIDSTEIRINSTKIHINSGACSNA